MNKLAVIAITALTAFVSWCGWLAYHYEGGSDNSRGLYAPNAMYRVRMPLPCPPACDQEQIKELVTKASKADEYGHLFRVRMPPPIGPDAIRQEQAILAAAAAKADANLRIDGREIVTSRGNMLDPERHDMAHVLYRLNHKLTKTME